MTDIPVTLLYIDPGTGSMLFTVVIGIVSALFFFFQKSWIKFKFFILGGRVKETDNKRIPYLIFSDHKRYWNVFKPICDEFEKREVELHYWTASEDDPVFKQDYKYVHALFLGKGNRAFAKLNMANAGICLSTTPGLDVYQWKRSKRVGKYIHIFHDVSDGLCYRMFALDYYDEVLLTGEFQERYLRLIEDVRRLKRKKTTLVGSTYMDDLYEKKQGLDDNATKAENGKLTVLLAPSWGESAILNKYGSSILESLIATGYHIIVRPHPQSLSSEKKMLDELMSKFRDNDSFEWNFDNDNFEVLNRADVLISDFSSVVYDYCLIFDRPIIYADTDFDRAPYDVAWVDEPLWRDSVLPKLGIELKQGDFANLKNIIADLVKSNVYQEGRNEVSAEVWQHKHTAAKDTVEYLLSLKGSGEAA